MPSSDELAAAPAAIMRATLTLENGMTGPDPSLPEPRLTLKSQLEDLTLVWPWAEAIAARYSVPADTQFAIQLCLEEALSNIIRHGYRGQPDQAISVECAPAGVENENAGELVFTIEDHAPSFDPLAPCSVAAPAPAPVSIQEFPPGGQGIRLMRKFASRLAWQQLANGNRLTLAFAIRGS
ncbi:MAG TPA: ATP-binding protein [Terracidiphilus sp.]|nr:ATP-binding protein [Terracidiphilus sp.]